MQEEMRRQWLAQQQQAAFLNAQAGQAIRQNPGLGRGLVIPGGPTGRPMPIRPNTGTSIPGPVRLPSGAAATPEQMAQMIKMRQLALATQQGGQNGVAPTPQQLQRLRVLQQQAQVNAAQAAAGQNATSNANANAIQDYMPFMAQANGTTAAQGKIFQVVYD